MKKTAAVITVSDKGYKGIREDLSGPKVKEILEKNGYEIKCTEIIPDEMEKIEQSLKYLSDEIKVNLIVTTGGTGFSERDVTPEATLKVLEKRADGICEKMRYESCKITDRGILSREVAGIRKKTFIINLPGSPKAAEENLNSVIKPIAHGIEILTGIKHEHNNIDKKNKRPSIEEWTKEFAKTENSDKCGICLTHLGKVRKTSIREVRGYEKNIEDVKYLEFSYDEEKVQKAKENALKKDGVQFVKIWLNQGRLKVGDDIMLVMVAADIRDNCIEALEELINELKTNCVTEKEIFYEL